MNKPRVSWLILQLSHSDPYLHLIFTENFLPLIYVLFSAAWQQTHKEER